MAKAFKILGLLCLVAIAVALAVLATGIYQAVSTLNRYLASADTYTCTQFVYDVEHEETDKLAPLMLATIAYGEGEVSKTTLREQLREGGIAPAVTKVYNACKQTPDVKVLNLFVADVTGQPLPAAASPTVAPNTAISPSTPTQQKQH